MSQLFDSSQTKYDQDYDDDDDVDRTNWQSGYGSFVITGQQHGGVDLFVIDDGAGRGVS